MHAFHNDQAIKDKYISRIKHHMEMDNLIRGTGWKDGKGCAVGCTLENYNHAQYPIELGMPQWLAHLEDALFEGMSLEKSKTWPLYFLQNANLGANLEKIKAPFLIFVLDSILKTFDHQKLPDVKNCIEKVKELYSKESTPQEFIDARAAACAACAAYAYHDDYAPACAAADAAYAGAYSAADAATTAANAAARTAARAAAAAARTATAGTYATAYVTTCDSFADKLLELMKGCE